MKKISTLLILLISAITINAQINAYAKVSLIVGPVITVSNVNETYGTFTMGQRVIVMQMQDDVIGSNTANNSNFGNLSSILNTGRYEVATIGVIARVAGIVNVITLSSPLSNSYNLGSNSSVQIISFPTLGGGGDYTTTSNITALPWDGNVGGVVAFHVGGRLHLQHNISADGAGFRGGVADASSANYGTCNATNYFNAVDAWFGNKGEGIYKSTNSNFAAGKGKMINAGGGANTINSGGGGGANFSGGGTGSIGWSCTNATGGIGGQGLNGLISGNRIFLGGGGGSGEGNDNANNKGGNGGGIVIISTSQIRTTGSGTALTISANGSAANNVANDGAGGGGAGGSVALEVGSWSVSSMKAVNITSNGAAGGNVGDYGRHGGGGGGGQGAVLFSGSMPAPGSNVTMTTSNGLGGYDYIGGPRSSSGQGTNNSGIFSSTFLTLPVNLISFTGVKKLEVVSLDWTVAQENNITRYEIQRSADATQFETIGTKTAFGSEQKLSYSYNDQKALATTAYYRLRIVETDGKSFYSGIVIIRSEDRNNTELSIFPNPATSRAVLSITSGQSGNAVVRILNMHGAVVTSQNSKVNRGENAVVLDNLSRLTSGTYTVQVMVNEVTQNTKLIIVK